MNLIKMLWFNILVMATAVNAQNIYPISGFVYDKTSEDALQDVNIQIGNKTGTSSDSSGYFRLELNQGDHLLRISHIGYYEQQKSIQISDHIPDTLRIFLLPEIIGSKETIVVEGNAIDPLDKNNDKWLNSTDDIMERFEGVNTMKRANFATEPVIRGSSAGQIAIVIDDMKMFHACVDRMDPVSAYVEVENLEKMELSKGGFDLTNSSVIGGTLNFITSAASLKQPLAIQSEAGFESVSELSRVRSVFNYAAESFAIRAGFSLKNSYDYYAGNNTLINNSGYQKANYTFSAVRKIGDRHTVRLNYIGDNARDIGYPALIMDATKTISHLASINYRISDISSLFYSFDLKTYYTRVEHWMDDYGRSKAEIKNRVVMPNMYMPMFGQSETLGSIAKGTLFPGGRHITRLILDYYRLNAFADMDMYALDNNLPPAYLVNIPDVRQDNLAFIIDHSWLASRFWQLRSNVRFDFSQRDIHNIFGKRQLQAMWDQSESESKYLKAGFSLSATYKFDPNISVSLNIADNYRLPTHMENYGYLLYNVQDGFFYSGNPQLKAEHSRQVELRADLNQKRFYASGSLFYTNISDYIGGRLLEDEFKLYTNFKQAYISGFETALLFRANSFLNLKTSLNYTYGFIDDLNEVMPYIPPFQGSISADFTYRNLWLELRSRFAADQNLAATKNTREDKTPGFMLWDVRSRFRLAESWEIKTGIENIFDRLYHDHLSIANLPGKGRNIYIGLNYSYD